MIESARCFVKLFLFLVVFNSQSCSSVIYKLNDTEYKKLPPIFRIDPYQECMQNPEGVYCSMELLLVSDVYSPLLDVIQGYSAHKVTHYNHSLLRYNLCVINICKEYNNNITVGLEENLEACLNETFQDRYGLKTRVLDNFHCKKANERTKTEVADYYMLALLAGILMLNIVGSLYDFICTDGQKATGINFFMYFAIRRNWRKLVAPAFEGPDLRLKRLKGLSFLKCCTTFLVISAHTMSLSVFGIDNTKYVEDTYSSTCIQLFLNGTIVVQTFFVISGFLLAYNLELLSERKNFTVNWLLLPKGIILRWIRLTPVYALILFFTVTCNKYLITGPLWHIAGMSEIEDCKQYWWQHLLYISNYNDLSTCMLHSWYLASDTQLYCLGLVIFIVCRTSVSRKVVLSILMLAAIVIPVVHTYWQDLDGNLVLTPEDFVHLLTTNKTYNQLYKRGHTNMFSYLVGLTVGFLAYHGQKINYDVQWLRKYRFLYYSMVPLSCAMMMTGTIFFREGSRPSLPVRMFFAAYQKLVWGLFMGIAILGAVFKYENFLRGIAEWHGWTPLSRLTYCAYLVHTTIIRLCVGQEEVIKHVTVLATSEHIIHTVLMSYLVAVPCWMLVEQPFGQLMKLFLTAPKKMDPADTATEVKMTIKGAGFEGGDKKIVTE